MKKKGLIISTIVMVLVLAASLTTATYAWFTSSAQATIDNISITTVASEGLEVSVYGSSTTSTHSYGELTWDPSTAKFGGDDGWGSLVDFAAVSTVLGSMDHAVTKYAGQTVHELVDEPAYAQIATYYVVGATAMVPANTVYTTEALFNEAVGAKFYTVVASPTCEFVKPIAYTTEVAPIGYEAAYPNADYLSLPIAVRATADMVYVFCTITITPNIADMPSAGYMPGMAAAARIELSDGSTTEDEFIPFSGITTGASGLTGYTDGDVATYSFVVAEGNIDVLDYWNTEYTIWVEGTDGQCIQLTAGSGFSINIEYSFALDETGQTDNNTSISNASGTYVRNDITKTEV